MKLMQFAGIMTVGGGFIPCAFGAKVARLIFVSRGRVNLPKFAYILRGKKRSTFLPC